MNTIEKKPLVLNFTESALEFKYSTVQDTF